MIEYLEQLVEDRKYQEAVKIAESLLKSVKGPSDVLRIHVAQVRALSWLGNYDAAFASGTLAKDLAVETGDWDSFGIATLFLGVGYGRLGQYQDARSHIFDYLVNLSKFGKALNFEHDAWYNLGILQLDLGETQEAIRSLLKALDAAVRRGNHRYAHGVRQSLVGAYLKAELLDPIPRLLAQCGHYFRYHAEMTNFRVSYSYYVKLRGEYLIATKRPVRAQLVALRAVDKVGTEPGCELLVHYVLAKAAKSVDNGVEALGHALAARTCAVAVRRSDYEIMVGELLYDLTQIYAESTEALDEYYLHPSV